MGDPFTAYVPGNVTQVSRMTNVPLSSWKSHLGIVAVNFLHQKPDTVVGDPFTAYVPGEVTQILRMTNVHH